jgi:hypothetical protein
MISIRLGFSYAVNSVVTVHRFLITDMIARDDKPNEWLTDVNKHPWLVLFLRVANPRPSILRTLCL